MNNPLADKRIVVTRPADQANAFCAQLAAAGARPIRFPTIRLEPMPDNTVLQRELIRLREYDRVVFTSVNGVRYAWAQLHSPWPQPVRTVAIGPATASALRSRNAAPEFVPGEFTAEQIGRGLDQVAGQKILLLRAQKARPILAEILRARQAHVTEVAVYRTLLNTPDEAALAALVKGFDALTFTSASTVKGFAAIGRRPAALVVTACIGPVTAEAARECGFSVDVIAREYTIGGLIRSLADHYGRAR
ncbi:MAG: uroporphyrinogen-III synthase [Bacteroidota bacterium]|nr:uroporphyrinogen-III synthase [Bacteroidota bacterium]MDE2956264.1 uroporphyrinogen-III synthase [Bacteroidota bacterium]